MEFSASHRFDRPLDQITAMFLDPDAHVGRYELTGAKDVQILSVDAGDGTLDLTTVRTMEGDVPVIAQKIISATNTVTTTDHWDRGDGSLLRGTSTIEATSVPGTATIEATVAPDGDGACTYEIQLALHLTIPLIGDRFVRLLRPQVMEIIDAEFEAWDRWLAHADAQ